MRVQTLKCPQVSGLLVKQHIWYNVAKIHSYEHNLEQTDQRSSNMNIWIILPTLRLSVL